MSNNYVILVTLSDGEHLIKAALKVRSSIFDEDTWKYPLEPDNKAKIAKLLPLHVRTYGSIVEVEEIFEVRDLTK